MRLWHRIRKTPVGVNRETRRAMHRLSRPEGQRAELKHIAAQLRPLSPEDRERVYASMDPDRVLELKWALRH